MSSTSYLDIAAVDQPRMGSVRSPFERTTLPAFAEWFAAHVDEYHPDYFVPVETKGARVLEAVDQYARRMLGNPLRVPVLYSPALNYFTDEDIRASRLLLLDDAISTGKNFERHRQRVLRHGGSNLKMLACVGLGDTEHDMPIKNEVECFAELDQARYRRMLWQLSELVVSRGLPPEVDHHVFRLRFRGQVADLWPELVELLSRFGQLNIDGTVTTTADVVSMTLHFPSLPGSPQYPVSGPARDEGVKKVRVFADLANNLVYVVPMAFPALELRQGADEGLDEDECREIAEGWTGQRPTVADLLLDRAQRYDPELLFRVISTITEFDLICAFARAIGGSLGTDLVSLDADRELLRRLYGSAVGEEVGDWIDRETGDALTEGPSASSEPFAAIPEVQPLHTDADVRSATNEIARHLQRLHLSRTLEPTERAGLSLTEITRQVRGGRIDQLLVSRSIDFGLAMTTLVPYTDTKRHPDGRVEVRRRYRVPERDRDAEHPGDMESVRRELAEEVIALIARDLRDRVDAWKDDGVPHKAIENVAAVINYVALTDQGVRLEIEPTESGRQVVLGPASAPQRILTVASKHFDIVGDRVQASADFESAYDDDVLGLDDYGSLEAVEGPLATIGQLLGDSDEVDDLLRAWAATAEPRRGLGVVEGLLRAAIDRIDAPIRHLCKGQQPDRKLVADAVEASTALASAAGETLALVSRGPARELREKWATRMKVERRLHESLAAPCDPPTLFDLANQTIAAVVEVAEMVRASNDWTSESDDPAVAEVVERCGILRSALTSLGAPEPTAAPGGDHDRRKEVGNALLRLCTALRTRAAAVAWTFRPPAPRHRAPEVGNRHRGTVMVADLARSTPRSLRDPHGEATNWTDSALNLVAQWARAFGGIEINERRGDDIYLEFASADRAVLCAAAVQAHAQALRAMGVRELDWSFRITITSGEVTVGEGRNVLGACVNVASKMKEFRKGDEGEFDRVLVAEQALDECSATIREELAERFAEPFTVELDPREGDSVSIAVYAVDAQSAARALLDRAGPSRDRQHTSS
jgi:hypothetical protein